MKEGKKCCPCRWIVSAILAITSILMILVSLGTIDPSGSFGAFVMTWWPAALLIYALSGFCPCHGQCKGKDCKC